MEADKETSKGETYTVTENVVSNVQKEVFTDVSEEILFVDDKEFEKKLLRKMDLRIVPLLALLYFLSFLDRVSIGNAKLAHLESDLGLVGSQFNWCLSIFFIGYIVFEVPSNLALIKTSASKWIPTTMVIWGIVMILMAFVKNFSQLMAARFFLGIFEAGLYPGVIYYVTMWYKRSEQNFRMALFTVGGSFAGSFAGLLAYAILKGLEGKANLKGWQWLFLVEGLSTIVVAFSAYFFITDTPEKAKWLSEQERKFAIARLKSDFKVERVEHFNKRQLYAALTDWKVYISMILLCALMIPGYSFALFLPSIVNGMGFDFIKSQLLSVPPFFIASLSTLVVAVFSDRARIRGPFIIVCSLFPIIGYILLIVPSAGTAGKYIGTCIAGMGIISCSPTSIAWLANNIPNNAKRGIALAMMLSWGNVGGIVASQIYRQKDYPHYLFGHLIAMGCMIIVTCSATTQYFLLKNINKKKKVNPQLFLKGKSEEEIKNMGDLHPNFIYSL